MTSCGAVPVLVNTRPEHAFHLRREDLEKAIKDADAELNIDDDIVRKKRIIGEMIYMGNVKDKSLLDFDIFFPKANYYGDLKASDIDKKEAPGNDQDNVLEAINKCGKLWYVIYEHKTIKDSLRNNEMAIRRMNLIGKEYNPGDEISYASKMKHSVEFKRMKIFELNRINLNETLSAFNQGHQPDGKSRKPKFLINKSNIDNFTVFSYDYDKSDYKEHDSNFNLQMVAEKTNSETY